MELKRNRGGAYTMVVIAGMVIFFMLTGTAAASAYGRRITGHYASYSGNYDLALSGNERAFFELLHVLQNEKETIESAVTQRALRQIESRLVYRNGAFFMEDRYIARLYKSEAEPVIEAYFGLEWAKRGQAYHTSWSAEIMFTQNGEAIQDIFTAETIVQPHSLGYTVSTQIKKSGGFPAEAEAEIAWPARITEPERFIPAAYAWREMPGHFSEGLLEGGLAAVTDLNLLDALYAHDEAALRITQAESLLAASAEPMLVIHTGPSVTVSGAFSGLIVAYGDITLDNANIHGAVWAEGVVVLRESAVIHDADILFDIPLGPPAQQDMFDFLRLTRFSHAETSSRDAAYVLDKLCFAEADGYAQGEILLNSFDVYAPSMVKSKRTAD